MHNGTSRTSRHTPAVNPTNHYCLVKIGFVSYTALRPSGLVHPRTAVLCLVDVKPVDNLTLSREEHDPSPLIPEVVGGTKVALYAVVKPTRPRRVQFQTELVPASEAISVTAQEVTRFICEAEAHLREFG
jgi:hypothetical protein